MVAQEIQVAEARILLIRGDITEQDADAVVNAANPSLLGGGGVDGAIHRKGGKKILEECKRIRATEWPSGLPTGKAVVTSAGNMKARYVIHTVGPVWHGGNHGEPELLVEAYCNSLRLAASMKLKSIAFPSISTGAYGYPVDKASRIALSTAGKFLKRENMLETIVFVLFTEHDLETYRKAAEEILTGETH